jgi:arabinogalactan oligomer / maltooligosaccharide transport system substrate-binding protein
MSEAIADDAAAKAAAADPDAAVDPLAKVRLFAGRAWPFAAVLFVALLALGLGFGTSVNWGDVPLWVIAVTTLLAFVAAVFAGLVAYELLRVESARAVSAAEERALAAAERADRRTADWRAQASKIAAWYGAWRPSTRSGPGTADGVSGAVIRNTSDLPIFEVRVYFCVAVDPASGLGWQAGERYSVPDLIAVVPPGEVMVEIPDLIREQEEAGRIQPKWRVAFEFTDAAGIRWLRDPLGRLTSGPERRG